VAEKAQGRTQGEEAAVKRRDDRVGRLFKKHRKSVKAILRRVGVDGPDVDDLAKNVFLVAQRRLAKLPQGRTVDAPASSGRGRKNHQ
jgi:DNA-directed RNA polymerase specialized sigma24 family protein